MMVLVTWPRSSACAKWRVWINVQRHTHIQSNNSCYIPFNIQTLAGSVFTHCCNQNWHPERQNAFGLFFTTTWLQLRRLNLDPQWVCYNYFAAYMVLSVSLQKSSDLFEFKLFVKKRTWRYLKNDAPFASTSMSLALCLQITMQLSRYQQTRCSMGLNISNYAH